MPVYTFMELEEFIYEDINDPLNFLKGGNICQKTIILARDKNENKQLQLEVYIIN